MTQDLNPYAPPASHVSDPGLENRPIAAASAGRRLGTFAIDYFCFFVLLIALMLSIGVEAFEGPSGYVFGPLIFVLYYIFFEGIWARTPGKFLFRTVVVNEQGGKPSMGQVVGRTFCRLLPFEWFSCFGERGWHDSIPKTFVVRSKKAH